MLQDPLFLLVIAAGAVVVFILILGMGSFVKNGKNGKFSNKMMRYRIYAQAVAIVLILIYVYFRR